METKTAKKSQETSMSKNEQIKLSDGRMLGFSMYGPKDGTPVIMHHGTPGSRVSADDELYHALGIRMIYPERPGYGLSSPNKKGSLKSWTEDVVELLNFLDIDEAQVAGASGGGAYTLACASLKPKRFYAATLIASVAPIDAKEYRKNMALMNKLGFWIQRNMPFIAKWGSQSFAKSFQENPKSVFDKMRKQLCAFDQEILEEALQSGMMEVFIEHINEAFKNGVQGHLLDMKVLSSHWNLPLENLQNVSIWHGEEDTLSPIEGGKHLSKLIPNAQTYFLPNAGHLLADHDETLEKILLDMRQKTEVFFNHRCKV